MTAINPKACLAIEFIFNTALLFFFTLLVVKVYPYPYYFVGDFIGSSGYDSEPDYFANIVSTLNNGHSMDFLHPGIFLVKIASFFINLSGVELTPENIIAVSRSAQLFINGILVYIGSRLILKQDLICTYILYLIFLLFPAGFVLVDVISPNSVLFGFSLLIISIGSLVRREISVQMVAFSILLGMALAIKYTSIILVLPLLASLALDSKNKNLSDNSLYKIAFIMSLISGVSFSIFSWPMLPFIPFALTHHGWEFNLQMIADNKPLIFFAFFMILLAGFLLNWVFANVTISNLYRKACAFLLSCLLIIFLINMFFFESFLSLGYSLRNYLLILGLIVLFVPKIFNWTIYQEGKYFKLLLSFMLLAIICLKLNFNNQFNIQSSKLEHEFSSFLTKFDHYDYLVFYPANKFLSKDIFIAWSDYRYGDKRTLFFQNQVSAALSERQKKVRVLNSRKYKLKEPEYMFSYRYFQFIQNNKFFSSAHQSVATNQMIALKPKSFCHELFDGFNSSKSTVIFFPPNLDSFLHHHPFIHDEALDYVLDFKSRLNKDCNIQAKIEEVPFNRSKIYTLLI